MLFKSTHTLQITPYAMFGGSVTDDMRRFVHAHVEGCLKHYGVNIHDSTATTDAYDATTSTNQTSTNQTDKDTNQTGKDVSCIRANHSSLEDLMSDYTKGLDLCKPLKVRVKDKVWKRRNKTQWSIRWPTILLCQRYGMHHMNDVFSSWCNRDENKKLRFVKHFAHAIRAAMTAKEEKFEGLDLRNLEERFLT